MTDSNTGTTSRPSPMEGDQPSPSINYAYGFGYASQAVSLALGMLRCHQYQHALQKLEESADFIARMKSGWNPED